MGKVLCTKTNASTLISGVKFTQVDGGMLSEDIDQETMEMFLSVSGYEEYDASTVKKPEIKTVDEVLDDVKDKLIDDGKDDNEDAKQALLDRAKELGINANKTWSNATLTKKIADAEAALTSE